MSSRLQRGHEIHPLGSAPAGKGKKQVLEVAGKGTETGGGDGLPPMRTGNRIDSAL